MTVNKLKLWWKQMNCKHSYEYEYWTDGIVIECKKCGKRKKLLF